VARKIEKAESEAYDLKGRLAPVTPHEEYSESHYLLLVLDQWKLIATITFVAIVITYVLTKTTMTPWYQATAIIEPIPEGAVENRVEGGIGGFAGGGMSSFLMSTGMDSQAQEYLTILRSYTFNTGVAVRHNLTDDLLPDEKRPATERKLKMKLFDILKSRFKVDYSIQGHNLSVHFIDLDPLKAQEILQYYLDDLRELQRQEAIRNAAAAIQSLEKEAGSTGDSLLRENLYALAARQVERQKLAEVEADFAFKVLEAPVSPDKPYSPRALLNCFVVMLLTPLVAALVIIIRDTRRAGRKAETLQNRRKSIEHGASF
jgi:hypothetical protein